MPIHTFKTTLLTATQIDNVFAGSAWEILTTPAQVAVAIVSDGGVIGDVLATYMHGSMTIGEEQPVSNANRFPVLPDDYTFGPDIAAALDRLKLKLRNPSASTRIITTVLRVDPL